MKLLIAILGLVCLAGSLVAQTTVSGTVVEENDRTPMQGVNIIVAGKSLGTTTDSEGNFTLVVEEEPPFEIRISMLGFETRTISIERNNQVEQIALSEITTGLDEVIISASRTPERVRESPVTIERMDERAIRNTTSPSFYDGLENLKGVDVNTSSITFKSVNTRGFATLANTRFVQLVDGMDNSSPALNFPIGNMLGMSELDVHTVELLPGASSALYGANAFNGIMFMRSKNPFEFQGVSFYGKTGMTSQKAAGNNPFVDAGFRAAKAFSEKFAAKVSVSFLNGKEWYATDYADYMNPGFTRDNPAYDGLNVYGDEVSTFLDFEEIANSLGIPQQYTPLLGAYTVSRTGYNEIDLIDYGAESLKADLSLNWRPAGDDLELIYNAKFGMGNTIYQGANRYSIQNFTMSQHKLELRNNNFFVRAYTTGESAGDSYDSRFAAINVNRKWKSDTQWFTDYASAYIMNFLGILWRGETPDPGAVHKIAREAAQNGAYLPNTPEFDKALSEVISDPDLTTGAKFIDDTRIYHSDLNYNFSHLWDFADVQVGGSLRRYSLNSSGSIFTDYDGPINYDEVGAYVQVQKTFADDRLKFTGSARYDKSQNFKGHNSPRVSLVYSAGEDREHNFRVSYQTGFRNPTTQDQYIGLDVGRAILVGSAPDNLDRYVSRPLDVSPTGVLLGFEESVILSGRAAYENSFSYSSVLTGTPSKSSFEYVQPERVKAWELGYRGTVGGVSIDLSGYFNDYENFIGNSTVLVPLYGNADLSDKHPQIGQPNALIALANEDFQPFQVYTNTNAEVTSYGVSIGISTRIWDNYEWGASYTLSRFEFDQSTDPDYEAGFNTPEHTFKTSFGNPEVIDNLGFNISFRWRDEYLWESSFVDAMVPASAVLDAQVNYHLKALKSIIKIGGANLGGKEYYHAPGTGHIGTQLYFSWTTTL